MPHMFTLFVLVAMFILIGFLYIVCITVSIVEFKGRPICSFPRTMSLFVFNRWSKVRLVEGSSVPKVFVRLVWSSNQLIVTSLWLNQLNSIDQFSWFFVICFRSLIKSKLKKLLLVKQRGRNEQTTNNLSMRLLVRSNGPLLNENGVNFPPTSC